MTHIKPADISVVVQGAVNAKLTPVCLRSIRKHLPGAEIILSTWQGTDVSNLDYDKLVLNDDPGDSGFRDVAKNPDNTNRQITSTINGLKQATRKYAVKLRTDFEVTGTGFLKFFDCKYKRRFLSRRFRLFEHRVLILYNFFDYPFSVADFFMFGLTKDLIKMWDIPLVSPEESMWMLNHTPTNPGIYPTRIQSSLRYFPEMHIGINCMKKCQPNIMDLLPDYTASCKKADILNEKFIMNNFITASIKDGIGIQPLKEQLQVLNEYSSFSSFVLQYQKYFSFINAITENISPKAPLLSRKNS